MDEKTSQTRSEKKCFGSLNSVGIRFKITLDERRIFLFMISMIFRNSTRDREQRFVSNAVFYNSSDQIR